MFLVSLPFRFRYSSFSVDLVLVVHLDQDENPLAATYINVKKSEILK